MKNENIVRERALRELLRIKDSETGNFSLPERKERAKNAGFSDEEIKTGLISITLTSLKNDLRRYAKNSNVEYFLEAVELAIMEKLPLDDIKNLIKLALDAAAKDEIKPGIYNAFVSKLEKKNNDCIQDVLKSPDKKWEATKSTETVKKEENEVKEVIKKTPPSVFKKLINFFTSPKSTSENFDDDTPTFPKK
jgi:hypothetical protein